MRRSLSLGALAVLLATVPSSAQQPAATPEPASPHAEHHHPADRGAEIGFVAYELEHEALGRRWGIDGTPVSKTGDSFESPMYRWFVPLSTPAEVPFESFIVNSWMPRVEIDAEGRVTFMGAIYHDPAEPADHDELHILFTLLNDRAMTAPLPGRPIPVL